MRSLSSTDDVAKNGNCFLTKNDRNNTVEISAVRFLGHLMNYFICKFPDSKFYLGFRLFSFRINLINSSEMSLAVF